MSKHPIRHSALTAATAFALLLSVQTDSTQARERSGAAARGGASAGAVQRRPMPRNGIVTRTTETRRTDNGYVRNSTVTNRQGETATRNTTVSSDRDAGVRSRETTITTFDGRTIERSVTKECDGAARQCTTTVVNDRDGS